MADVHSKLSEEVTCSICHEYFKTPKQLDCLHRFCQHCLHDYIMSRDVTDQGMPCPTCRQFSRGPKNLPPILKDLWSKHYPTDFVISSICEKLKEERDMCPFHVENQLLAYCTDCQESICHVCAAVQHRRCEKVDSLQTEAKKERERQKKYEECLSRKEKSVENNIGLIKTEIKDLKTNYSQTVKNIKMEFDTVRQHLAKKEKQLVAKLDTIMATQTQLLNDAETSNKIVLTSVTTEKRDVSTAYNLKLDAAFMARRKRRFREFDIQATVQGSYANKTCSPVKKFKESDFDIFISKIVPHLNPTGKQVASTFTIRAAPQKSKYRRSHCLIDSDSDSHRLQDSDNGSDSDRLQDSDNGSDSDRLKDSDNGSDSDRLKDSDNGSDSDRLKDSDNGSDSDSLQDNDNGSDSDSLQDSDSDFAWPPDVREINSVVRFRNDFDKESSIDYIHW